MIFTIGLLDFSIGDCTGNVRLQFEAKEGSNLVQIKKFNIKIKVGKGSLKLSNLFNGDKVLGERKIIFLYFIDCINFYYFVFLKISGDAVNAVINENFDVVSKDIIPLVEKALQRLLKRISSRILENFTHDQVFPQ